MQSVNFDTITTTQALVVLSHMKAIAENVRKEVQAYIRSKDAEDANGEPVFINQYKRIRQLPLRKFFVLEIDGKDMQVQFPETLDLQITIG